MVCTLNHHAVAAPKVTIGGPHVCVIAPDASTVNITFPKVVRSV